MFENMASNECLNCIKLNEIISEQKSKISFIEIRLKDLVKAYKKVCIERDVLSMNSTAVLPLNDSKEQQKRLSYLESSIADMSAICGEYESQSIKDKQLIEELTQKCEQMSNELKCNESMDQNPSQLSIESEKTFRQRGIQTEDWFESTIDTRIEANTELENMCKEVETQTDFGSEFDAFSGSNRKKSELAVVLPTVSETQQQNDCDSDCDQLSNRSRSRSQSIGSNLDNYPVFASNSRDNNDLLFSSPNSSGVSLFYANELARKEINLAETRLQAREYECALRELQWKYNTDKYRLQSRINDLEKHYSQMSSNQPMNHLNITYVRNVLIKLLNTRDKQQKQFMINAILTALEQKDKKPK